jgi:hypothetical protein
MKEDINPPKVDDIAIAVVRETAEDGESGWFAYFLNLRPHDLEGVLVRSNGYGLKGTEKIKTTELRHFLDKVPRMSSVKIEPIVEGVFSLSNQFWISFFHDNQILDRKVVFVPGSIDERNFVTVPILNVPGVLIK